MSKLEVSLSEEKNHLELLEEYLGRLKTDLDEKMVKFKTSWRENGETSNRELCSRSVNLCRELTEMLNNLTSDILKEDIIQDNPTFNRLSPLTPFIARNRDSGISSASGSSVWNGSQRVSTNRLSNLVNEDTQPATFTISPSESAADLGQSLVETYNPSIGHDDGRCRLEVLRQSKSDTWMLRTHNEQPVVKLSTRLNIVDKDLSLAENIANTCQIQVKLCGNLGINFDLKFRDITSLRTDSICSSVSNTSLSRDVSKLSVLSSDDSVIDMTLPPSNEPPGLNDLSQHSSSSSSEEDNTKRAVPVPFQDGGLKQVFDRIEGIVFVGKK